MNSIKEVEKKRKQVFKPLLDNPFTQAQFPIIKPSIQDQILDFLLHILEDIGKHETLLKSKPDFTPEEPESLKNMTLGFNSTVQWLEEQARGTQTKQLSYVIVCKADIQPALLTSQFPVLSYTASTENNKVKLVQLPRGSMDKIEKALGKKAGIIGLQKDECFPDAFLKLIDANVNDVEVPWLKNSKFVNPNIKILKTTAPIAQKKNNNNNKRANSKVQKK